MISPKYISYALLLTPLALVATTLSAQAEPTTPTPGDSHTKASLLAEEEDNLAQIERRRRRRPTRQEFSPNYFGIGLNVGFDGDKALGDTNFAVNSRIKLGSDFSFRPSAVIGENASFLVPVTYDFTAAPEVGVNSLNLIPYVGGGAFFSTGDDSEDDIGGLVTAGLDVPISRQLTANAGLNVGFLDGNTEWGLLLGVGYNIPRN